MGNYRYCDADGKPIEPKMACLLGDWTTIQGKPEHIGGGMQVGDLVQDLIDFDLGIITQTKYQMDCKVFYVVFFNGDEPLNGWYGDTELEVICK